MLLNYSCGIKKNIIDSDSSTTPKRHFFIDNNFQLDYSDKKNWAFRSDLDDFNDILPKNYNIKDDVLGQFQDFLNWFFIYIQPLYIILPVGMLTHLIFKRINLLIYV